MHGTNVTILTPLGAKQKTRQLSAINCTLRYGPTRSLQCRGFDNVWYQGEDVMDPGEVPSPVRSVGQPNVDGSIGGNQGNALPPNCPTRQYSYYGRELR